ncbi:MAG: hypothetical protein R3F39_11260 [Myxococcota bacterium]
MRLCIGAAIVLSLLPLELPPWATWAFLTLFTVELALRSVALHAPRLDDEPADLPRWLVLARRSGFLLLDAAALASFFPGVLGIPDSRWLRLFRLARLVLLIRYWSTLISDLRAVLLRRERARKVALMGGAVALVSFCGTVLLDHLTADRVDFDGDGAATDHDSHFVVRLWWAFRQVQDPGNMLSDPSDLAVVAVSLGLTVFGLFLVSFLIGLGTDVVREVIDIAANRPAGLSGHTVVVGVNGATRPLLEELMAHYHKSAMRPHFAVVGETEMRPHFLDDPALSRVVYRHGHAGEEGYLERVDVDAAKRVLLLADPQSPSPDAATLGLILSVRDITATPRDSARRVLVVAEVLDPGNLGAARVAGGPHTVTVPSEQLIGLFVSAVVREPGLAALLVALLTSKGHESYSYLFGSRDLAALPLPGRWPDFEALSQLATAHPREPCVPIAWLTAADRDPTAALVSPTVHLAPGPGPAPADAVGFFAISPSFRVTRALAARVGSAASAAPSPSENPVASVLNAPFAAIDRALICGSRAASFDLCEALMRAHPGVVVTLLVDDDAALQAFHDRRAERRIIASRAGVGGPGGVFRPADDGALTFQPSGGGPACGRLTVHAADWTSERVLAELPGSGAHVRDMDAVIYLAAPTERSDGRTAMSVLKLAELQAEDGGFRPGFRVVAAVTESSLRRHLHRRYVERVGADAQIAVFSSQELRAWFAFQAAAVPGFYPLYSELLSPGGHDLRRRQLSPEILQRRALTFPELGRLLRAEGRILVAVETRADADAAPELHIVPASQTPGYDLELALVDAVWLIERSGRSSP